MTGDKPIFCTRAEANSDLGLCALTEARCDAARADLQDKTGDKYLECASAKGASCFNATHLINNTTQTICAPSVSHCENLLVIYSGNPDFKLKQEKCGVYRTTAIPRDALE